MLLDDPLTVTIIIAGVIVAASITYYAYRRRGKRGQKLSLEEESAEELKGYPFKIGKSVPKEDASRAKNELRILELEREILSDSIRRLYEAQAEGKITEEERERLGHTYKARMMVVKDSISKDESLVALNELETMQEDLMRMFSERFDELAGKIDELRSRVEVKPIKEIAIPLAKIHEPEEIEEKPSDEERAKRKRKPPQTKPSPRTEAEKRIEEIRAEVEKVLDRLGQMEVES